MNALHPQLLSGKSDELIEWIHAPSKEKILLTIGTIIIGCGLYGATIGIWRSPLMGFYVALKLPLLIFLTLGCNGILNGILALKLGSGLTFKQSLLCLLMSFSVLSLILGALSPITLFFSFNTPVADSEHATITHSFLLLFHTSLIAYAGVIANIHLYRTLTAYCPNQQSAKLTLYSWLLGNAFVGAQFSWILRPFFGSPNLDVAFLRPSPMEGTFYGAVFRSLKTLFSTLPPHYTLLLWVLTGTGVLISIYHFSKHSKLKTL